MIYYSDKNEYMRVDKKNISNCCKKIIWLHIEDQEITHSVCAGCGETNPLADSRSKTVDN